jgi:hypothetical protein
MTKQEARTLKSLAKKANLSLSRYLVVKGLNGKAV